MKRFLDWKAEEFAYSRGCRWIETKENDTYLWQWKDIDNNTIGQDDDLVDWLDKYYPEETKDMYDD
jgi:hypothetical protein